LFQIVGCFLIISRGSVATRLRYGGIFNDYFMTHLQLSLTVKELWKSINIWRRYGHESSASPTHPVSIHILHLVSTLYLRLSQWSRFTNARRMWSLVYLLMD